MVYTCDKEISVEDLNLIEDLLGIKLNAVLDSDPFFKMEAEYHIEEFVNTYPEYTEYDFSPLVPILSSELLYDEEAYAGGDYARDFSYTIIREYIANLDKKKEETL